VIYKVGGKEVEKYRYDIQIFTDRARGRNREKEIQIIRIHLG